MDTPTPRGGSHGTAKGNRFKTIRTLDGHRAEFITDNEGKNADIQWRANARTPSQADLSGEYPL